MPNGIELDDFGNRKLVIDINPPIEKSKEDSPTTTTMIEDQRPISTMKQNDYIPRHSPPPSPPPFSRYTPQAPLEAKPVPAQNHYPVEAEEDRGGCCKCVIM